MDFGTSNSLASSVKNNQIEFVCYADSNISNPTILYFPGRSKQVYIGNEGVERYLTNLEESGIGGGTSDICVIETSLARFLSPDRLGDIKAVGGVREAGDELSSQIMKHKLASKFGDGSIFKSLGEIPPFPSHIIYKLSKWHRINLLNNPSDRETIHSIYPSSNRPENVKRLLNLIDHHYGFDYFEQSTPPKNIYR